MLRNLSIVFALLSFTALVAGVASADTFTDLSALTSGYYKAAPCGVNSSGAVSALGTYSGGTSSYYHVYLYTGGTAGTMNDLNSKFATMNTADAINESGQMAVMETNTPPGVLYSGGTNGTVTTYKYGTNPTMSTCINGNGDEGGYTNISTLLVPYVYTGGTAYILNSPYTGVAAGILAMNTDGQAVGFNKYNGGGVGPGRFYATVWTYTISGGAVTAQTATDIHQYIPSSASYMSSQALAVNGSGIVVGGYNTGSGGTLSTDAGFFTYDMATNAVTLLNDPTLGNLKIDLPYASSLGTCAGLSQSINDSNQVVGEINVSGVYHAALWQNGAITDLNAKYASILNGFVINNATAIDNKGDIAGYGTDTVSHTIQAFVILVPEPGALTLLAGGFAALSAYVWRRRK